MSQNMTNTANVNASNSMFCFQCEQTAGCTGCTRAGVCGKSAMTAKLQDTLTGALIALANTAACSSKNSNNNLTAVLMDEICAWVVLRKLQTTGVTSKMETRYRKSVDTKDSHIVLRASIKEVKRNIVIVEAKLYNEDGEVCTESVCTYFTFSKEKSKDEMHFTKCDVEPEEILPLI